MENRWTFARGAVGIAGAVLSIALALPAASPPTPAPPTAHGPDVSSRPSIRRGAKHRFVVHFEDVVRNEGTVPLRDVHCDLLLPVEDGRQSVRWLRLSPHGWTVRTDVHGERIASAVLPSLAPGDATTFSWIASVEVAEERHVPGPPTSAPVPPDVRRYLEDGLLFRLSSKAVRAAAEDVRRAAADGSPLAIVRAASAYVRERVDYACEGGWDAAPTVLARGTGSCTEATYAFVAICRRLGVPARWIGGTMRRGLPSGRGLDTMFHRMAEAWVPGHGWLPVEPTRGRAEGDGIGRISGSMLRLAVGDGTGDAGTGSAYFARDRWGADADGKAARGGRAACRATWLPDGEESSPPALAAILACDARGFGPACDADGRPIAHAAVPVAPRTRDAVRTLLSRGEPEGVHLLAEVAREDLEGATALLRSGCDASLAAELTPFLAKGPASLEGWWTQNLRRVLPRDGEPLRLAATTQP